MGESVAAGDPARGAAGATMTDCCDSAACEIEKLQTRQISTLRIVFGINTAMFVVELVTGMLAGSVSLVADSLDMLGDALAYGLSLYVVRRSARWKARSATRRRRASGCAQQHGSRRRAAEQASP